MKYRKGLLAALLWVGALLIQPAWAAPSDALLQEGEIEFDAMAAQLRALDKQEFLADMKRAFLLVEQGPQAEDENALVPWTATLQERLGEYTRQELADEILDGGNGEMFRAVMIQLHELMEDAGPTDPRLYQMLLDEGQPEYLRTTLLLHLDFDTPEQMELLRRLRESGPADMAAFAEKILLWSDTESSYTNRPPETAPAPSAMGEEEKEPWSLLLLSVAGLALAFGARMGARRWKEAAGEEEE